jgi:hypothetical protein
VKRISRFLPSERCTRDQADAHYENVHHRFAMRMFRDHAPTVRLYAINHAVAQRDLAGTFQQRPHAWRFVILDVDERGAAPDSGGKEWLPQWAERSIVLDHTNFLREVRPFEVEPTEIVDRRNGQTSLVKILVECGATAAESTAAAESAYDRFWSAVAENGDAFGLRLAVGNRALREAEMMSVLEPGQAYTGRYLESTTMTGFGELYFDHSVWAEEFFRIPAISETLRPSEGVDLGVYAVRELVGVDRR